MKMPVNLNGRKQMTRPILAGTFVVAAMIAAHWIELDFDASEPAFYYVRVLEIPTPRWTTHDAAFFGIDLPDNVPATIQDRAYTSPIWYTPAK